MNIALKVFHSYRLFLGGGERGGSAPNAFPLVDVRFNVLQRSTPHKQTILLSLLLLSFIFYLFAGSLQEEGAIVVKTMSPHPAR